MKVHEITILKPIEVIEIYMFLKYLHTQINKSIKFERKIKEATFFF